MTDETATNGNRGNARRRVLKGGVVVFNQGRSTLPCIVRDLSETGARLRFNSSFLIPDVFELTVDLDGLEAPCAVTWRRGLEMGVRFSSEPRLRTPRRPQVVTAAIFRGPGGL